MRGGEEGWQKETEEKRKTNSKVIHCLKSITINFQLHSSTCETFTDGQMNSSLKDLIN